MDPHAATIRALVAERAADARVTAATGRGPRPLAADAATFLAQEEQAAARRRRSQSGRRARPEPPHLVTWAEGVEAPPLSPPRAAMAAPAEQHSDGRSRGQEQGWWAGWEGWQPHQESRGGHWSWEDWKDWSEAPRGGREMDQEGNAQPWEPWGEVQKEVARGAAGPERDEEIARGAAGPEAREQQEMAYAAAAGVDASRAPPSQPPGLGPLQINIFHEAETPRERAPDGFPAAEVAPRSAAVAAPANPRAVAGRSFTMGDFDKVPIRYHYRQHNAALKFLREVAEAANEDEVPCEDEMDIGKIQKPSRGGGQDNMDYWFKDGETVKWSWHEMIAHMAPATRDLVVNGSAGRSGGLDRCALARRPNSYSHKRCYAARAGQQHGRARAGEHQAEYDFVVYRADGTALRFHPDWNKRTFPLYELSPHAAPVRAPRQGYGGSWGEGCYKHYKELDKIGDGEFDSQQGSHVPPKQTGYP